MQEKYEVTYIEDIHKDFLNANLSESKVLKIKDKMEFVALAPFRRTEQIENWNDAHLRKTRFGDYRMFIEVDENVWTITCLSFLHRSKCYSSQNKKHILTILEKIRNSKIL